MSLFACIAWQNVIQDVQGYLIELEQNYILFLQIIHNVILIYLNKLVIPYCLYQFQLLDLV